MDSVDFCGLPSVRFFEFTWIDVRSCGLGPLSRMPLSAQFFLNRHSYRGKFTTPVGSKNRIDANNRIDTMKITGNNCKSWYLIVLRFHDLQLFSVIFSVKINRFNYLRRFNFLSPPGPENRKYPKGPEMHVRLFSGERTKIGEIRSKRSAQLHCDPKIISFSRVTKLHGMEWNGMALCAQRDKFPVIF